MISGLGCEVVKPEASCCLCASIAVDEGPEWEEEELNLAAAATDTRSLGGAVRAKLVRNDIAVMLL